MSIIASKCASCKKYRLLEESPWCACTEYSDEIPTEYYSVDIDDETNCSKFEYDPDWNKD